ncbi:hypothetical protein NC652_020609 [Populus alba x Populus x berolinensis]|nr:hypothetical protein NC652_020609 [Populus alba x Populus x berolinensis]
MEDSLKKVTIATETTHNHQPISKENHIAIEQGVFSKKRERLLWTSRGYPLRITRPCSSPSPKPLPAPSTHSLTNSPQLQIEINPSPSTGPQSDQPPPSSILHLQLHKIATFGTRLRVIQIKGGVQFRFQLEMDGDGESKMVGADLIVVQ